MRTATAFLLFLLAGASSAQAPDAEQLFLTNCASCHGETGDGKGTTELDRPARSFKDGGFSYGNTPDALYRTISNGIPGTPMPGFDTSLSEDERRLLADYVITLGPEVRDVTTEETIMEVRRRPVVVRGMLPPIGPEAVSRPRGLLLGTTSGMTFEYRADDVRLLGVRQGAFVERTDWTGRGGSALNPLGKVVYLAEGGNPQAYFRTEAGPLVGELEATLIEGTRVGVRYRLEEASDEGERAVARVFETVSSYGGPVAGGFRRDFLMYGLAPSTLRVDAPRLATGDRLRTSLTIQHGANMVQWWCIDRANGTVECLGILVRDGWTRWDEIGKLAIPLAPAQPGAAETATALRTMTIVAYEWSSALETSLEEVSFQ